MIIKIAVVLVLVILLGAALILALAERAERAAEADRRERCRYDW